MNTAKCCTVFLSSFVMIAAAGCGGGGNGDGTNQQTSASSSSSLGPCLYSTSNSGTTSFSQTSATLSLLAGKIGGPGSIDGPGTTARFSGASSVATDPLGNIYVADAGNSTIRKIDSLGQVSTLTGSPGAWGYVDGKATDARFGHPKALAVDSAGNIYVADSYPNIIRKITPYGIVSTLAGGCITATPSMVDGTGAAAEFQSIADLAVGSDGTMFVADYGAIRKVTPNGTVTTLLTTIAGQREIYSAGLVVDSAGNLLVAQQASIWRVSPAGQATILAGTDTRGYGDGPAANAKFDTPTGIAVDKDGNVYVAEGFNQTVRKISSDGIVTTIAGAAGQTGNTDGIGGVARFNNPSAIAIDPSGNLIVADSGNLIRKISPSGSVTTIAGTPSISGFADGSGSSAMFGQDDPYYLYGPSYLSQIAADSDGNLFVADTSNHVIRKVSSSGDVTTFAGQPGVAGAIDGNGTQARFATPVGIVANGKGELYVSDKENHTIRKITKDGTVTTLAGSPSSFSIIDGNGNDAGFNSPTYLAIDPTENLYVIDRTFSIADISQIRKVTSNGDVTTLALNVRIGSGRFTRYGLIKNIAFASDGNLYVTAGNYLVRISLSGAVTEISGGNIAYSYNDGNGATVAFNEPQGIAADKSGNLYVADSPNHVVRKVSLSGVSTTVVGQPYLGGFLPGPTPGALANPTSLAISGNKLFIKMDNAVVVVSPLP